MKLPAIQFYPADWRKDPGVQSLDYFDRGVWFEILCLMHESPERGKLLLNGQPMPDEALARILGLDNQILTKTLTTLLRYGVASRDEETGALISRRMVRDESVRKVRTEAGKRGGNPVLLNLNPTTGDKQTPTTGVNQKSTPSSSSSSSSSDQPLSRGATAKQVFNFWAQHLEHPQAIFTAKRERAVLGRLKEGYTVDQIVKAIRGCKLSPHNMGENDRHQVFDDLELICRDGTKLERFIGIYEGRSNGHQNPSFMASAK